MDRIKTILDQYRYQIIFGVTGALLIVLILLLLLLTGSVSKKSSTIDAAHSWNLNSNSHSISDESTSEVTNNGPLFVDIKGAVNKPGMYQAKKDSRVSDIINMAGGLKHNADIKTVNLAQKITDQQIIYVPRDGEQPSMEVSSSSTLGNSFSSNTGNSKVNINTADANQMQQVNGIGEKRAEQIIAYRNEHGQFRKIDDIKNVSGFGDKMFENMKESITV